MDTPTASIEGAETLIAVPTHELVEALPFVLGSTVLSHSGDEYVYQGTVTFLDGFVKHAFARKSGNCATNTYHLVSSTALKDLESWRRQLTTTEARLRDKYSSIRNSILYYYEEKPRSLKQLQVASFLRKKLEQQVCLEGPKPASYQECKELVELFTELPELTHLIDQLRCIDGWSQPITDILSLLERNKGQ